MWGVMEHDDLSVSTSEEHRFRHKPLNRPFEVSFDLERSFLLAIDVSQALTLFPCVQPDVIALDVL